MKKYSIPYVLILLLFWILTVQTAFGQALSPPVSATVNIEPLTIEVESSDPLAAFSEGAEMSYSITILLESALDIDKVHIELGTVYGSSDIVTFEVKVDGSDMPEGLVVELIDNVLKVELGEYPLRDPINGLVYFLSESGESSSQLAFTQ